MPAAASDNDALAKIRTWHQKLDAVRGAIPVELGTQARQVLDATNLAATNLDRADQVRRLELDIWSALAVGHAAGARARLEALQALEPRSRSMLKAAWLVATAAGDAALGKQVLDELERQRLGSAGAIRARRERLEAVGKPAPDKDVVVDLGRPVPLRRREGEALLLCFWRADDGEAVKHAEALQALYAETARLGAVAFVGINSDGVSDLTLAKKFARDHGFTWAQHYEKRSTAAPLTEQAFQVKRVPFEILIDQDGNLRAAGRVTESGFVYAVRAAATEAANKAPAVRARGLDGTLAPPAPSPRGPVVSGGNSGGSQVADEPPKIPEARKLLDQARLYLKTGRKRDAKKLLQELIEKYPHSWEAREARRLGLI
jgi:peroxiredoxin